MPVKTRSFLQGDATKAAAKQRKKGILCRTIHSKSGEHFDAVIFSQFFLSLVNVVQQVGFNHRGIDVSFNTPHNFDSDNIVMFPIMTFKHFPECAFP